MTSTGNRGTGLLDLFALVVDERAHFSERSAGDDDVADAKRAVLHQNGRDGTAAAMREPTRSRRRSRGGSCLPCSSRMSASSSTVSSSLSMPSPVRAETGTISMLPPQSTGCRPSSAKLLLDAVGLCVRFVHLVDGDDDRNVRRLDVRDRFLRLRHDAVVGRDDQDRDVGDFRTARAHRGERFVTGRIDERDLAIVSLDGVRADLLRDAAGLAARDVGLTDLIEQRRLAVVDVAEHRDDRRTRRQHLRLVLFLLDRDFFAGLFDDRVEPESFLRSASQRRSKCSD